MYWKPSWRQSSIASLKVLERASGGIASWNLLRLSFFKVRYFDDPQQWLSVANAGVSPSCRARTIRGGSEPTNTRRVGIAGCIAPLQILCDALHVLIHSFMMGSASSVE